MLNNKVTAGPSPYRMDKNNALMHLCNAGVIAHVSAYGLTIKVYIGDPIDRGTWMEVDSIAIRPDHSVSCASVARAIKKYSR